MKKFNPSIKFILFFSALVIASSSLIYTNFIVKKIADSERKKIELWAEAYKEVQEVDLDEELSMTVFKIIQENKTIPVILADEKDSIIAYINLDTTKIRKKDYLQKQLSIMKESREAIVIDYYQGKKNFIYYQDSLILKQLVYYPYIQLAIVFLFVLAAFFAFRSSQRAEENQVWVGMSKETAHQLGTPISSLLAWIEMLKLNDEDHTVVDEVTKDINRLETITERFSKIGSKPVLKETNVIEILDSSVEYLKRRTSSKVAYILNFGKYDTVNVPLNVALFEWVVENLCKNAIDAMAGIGSITIDVTNNPKNIFIEITDTGKGIPKSKYKTVFRPGYTSKKRGWGLGLSLAKRIIEIYHKGKIFVKTSEVGKGTTFKIILKK